MQASLQAKKELNLVDLSVLLFFRGFERFSKKQAVPYFFINFRYVSKPLFKPKKSFTLRTLECFISKVDVLNKSSRGREFGPKKMAADNKNVVKN